jgi:DnaJ-class molecular chaperone
MSIYVKCPRCEGRCQVFAYTRIGNGFAPSEGEYFQCPVCHGTGEADEESAREYERDQKDDADDDDG